MESLLRDFADCVALALQAIAIVIVVAGSARAVASIVGAALVRTATDAEKRAVWLEYARWLVAALTFQLAADIVGTSFSQTWDELGRLAVVAVIRTFLSHFLDSEVAHNARLQAVGRSEPGSADAPRSD
jgi:uncharacterized membrane protein